MYRMYRCCAQVRPPQHHMGGRGLDGPGSPMATLTTCIACATCTPGAACTTCTACVTCSAAVCRCFPDGLLYRLYHLYRMYCMHHMYRLYCCCAGTSSPAPHRRPGAAGRSRIPNGHLYRMYCMSRMYCMY
jgi:hypothetical protein